jgi:SSS family transporter
MLIALHTVDYGVLLLYLAVMVAIGAYFSRQQHTSRDFFLAGRSMGWFPVGLSIMATLLSALSYTGIPGAAYHWGLKLLASSLCVWLTVPVLLGCVLPLYHRLGIYSVYEYLEMRFDTAVRFVSSVVFILWRLLWLGGVLYAPCKVLVVAAGLDMPVWLLIIILGAASTAYTFLGGMKAVIWTDVIQSFVMLFGLLFIVGSVWWSLDGGAGRVWQVSDMLGRTQAVEWEFAWDSYWSVWGIIPHFALSVLSFYVADQITAQRFLTAKSLQEVKRSFLLNCVSVSVMSPALLYCGLTLLAFYHDHPEDLRPKWVVNVNAETRQSLTYADRDGGAVVEDSPALIDWFDPNSAVNAQNLPSLVADGRVLHPNSMQPFTSVEGLLSDSNPEGLDIEKLAKRKPPHGEVVLNAKSNDELLPWYIRIHMPWGIAGLILAALFAASMSSMDSGLNSVSTLLITDFHRRLGWGRHWLAKMAGKPVEALSEADELRLGRPMVLIIGIAATLFSLLVARIGDIFDIMIAVVNTFGGPLMAVFLLGMLTRRCTAKSALVSLITGTLFTVWMTAANKYPSLEFLWPFSQKISSVWPLFFGVAFTWVLGYLLGFCLGRVKSKSELRGLVLGHGELGIREAASEKIQPPLPPPTNDTRWK